MVRLNKIYTKTVKKLSETGRQQTSNITYPNNIKHSEIFSEVDKNEILATGGRVLNFVSISDNFKNSRDQVLEKIEKLNWENGFYRSDIGYKVINK